MKWNNSFDAPGGQSQKRDSIAARCLRACGKIAREFARVKSELTQQFQSLLDVPDPWLQQTVNEAEALAWQTGFPHLLFPVLAEEKVRKLGRWYSHQQMIQGQNYQEAA